MSEDTNDPLAEVENEWAALRVVEARHSTFHMHPSPEAAHSLIEAVKGWVTVTSPPAASTSTSDSAVEKLAVAMHRRDVVLYRGGVAESWSQADEVAREQYLNDARFFIKAMLLYGWHPAEQAATVIVPGWVVPEERASIEGKAS